MIDEPAPITEHLGELRKRLFWVLGTLVFFSAIAFNYSDQIFLFLMKPVVQAIEGSNSTLQAISPTETFFTYLKCSLLAGFVLSLPVVFWHLWSFIAPGLYDSEKRAVIPFVFVSSVLFITGAVFGYTQVFPLVFDFLSGFDQTELIAQNWTMALAFSTTARLFLAFGVAFELPVLVFFLAISGIVTTRQLWSRTPYAILLIFIAAAILTPPDFVSQILLAVPMLLLYLLGIGVAWLFDPARRNEKNQPDHSQ